MAAPVEPHRTGYLESGDGHKVYWEESGNPDGIPALYLHGGPGGTLRPGYRKHFDPERYRIIGVQQRGAGASTPSAAATPPDLAHLGTADLLADLERLRAELGVEAWLVSGVSWGSTLALQHALADREAVLGLVLVAVTTTSPAEVRWITEGVQLLYPEAWQRLAGVVARLDPRYRPGGGVPLVEAVAGVMAGADAAARLEMADAWCAWEDTHVGIGLPVDQLGLPGAFSRQDDDYRLAITTLVTTTWARHLALDAGWVPPGGVLAHLAELEGLPACLVHGRRDVSGPVATPWQVHRALPGSRLFVVEEEGHGGARMMELWREATDCFAATGGFAQMPEVSGRGSHEGGGR